MVFKNGDVPWNKGKHGVYSEETLKKMSEKKHGKYIGKNHPFYGKHHTVETKKKIGLIHKGKKISDEHRKKVSEFMTGRRCNENNPSWKGNNASYKALHQWVRRHKHKPELCEICNNKTPYDTANISGEYKRDVNDYQWLCRACHFKNHAFQRREKQRRIFLNTLYGI
jgi:hypothetical protein